MAKEYEDDYEDIQDVLQMLADVQENEQDIRDEGRSNEHFIYKKDGQWEPQIISLYSQLPRYTFDKTTPKVESVCGELEQMDFDIKIIPANSESNDETAKIYDGLIRNIENISDMPSIIRTAARGAYITAQDGWRVRNDYLDYSSFDQDLIIEKINNFNDRVWFDPNSQRSDRQDAEWVVVLDSLTCGAYEERFEKEDGELSYVSVGEGRSSDVYSRKPEFIIIGELIYRRYETTTIMQMSNGWVLEKDSDDYLQVKDELEAAGVTVVRERKTKKPKMFSRFFDGSEWLSDAQETPFLSNPVVPVYPSFIISEDKPVYISPVSKLKDPQRVYNYIASRQVGEAALSPREKIALSEDQADGYQGKYSKLNTDQSAVFVYKHVDGQSQPFKIGGYNVNPGLETLRLAMSQDMIDISGVFDVQMGNNPQAQSGVAIGKLQNKGDISSAKIVNAIEFAMARTARILIESIPLVYDAQRQVRIIGQDGSSEIKTLYETVIDEQTGQMVTLNDLSKGKYDVVCSAGAAFSNRQQETVAAITEMAVVDPSIIQFGQDVLLKNTNAPGMDILAERARDRLFKQGMIPESQLTEEERRQMAMAQQSQQDQPPSPEVMAAQALQVEAQAKMVDAETKQQKVQIDAQIQAAKLQDDRERSQFDMLMEQMTKQNEVIMGMAEFQKTQAETLKLLREAMGVDAAISAQAAQNYEQQNQEIAKTDQIIDENLNRV